MTEWKMVSGKSDFDAGVDYVFRSEEEGPFVAHFGYWSDGPESGWEWFNGSVGSRKGGYIGRPASWGHGPWFYSMLDALPFEREASPPPIKARLVKADPAKLVPGSTVLGVIRGEPLKVQAIRIFSRTAVAVDSEGTDRRCAIDWILECDIEE